MDTGRLWFVVFSCILARAVIPASGNGGQCYQDVPSTHHMTMTAQLPYSTTHFVNLSEPKRVHRIKFDLQNCIGAVHPMNISVEYADMSDVMLLKRTYHLDCLVGHGKHLTCDLPRPTPVHELHIVVPAQLDCASIQLLGCAISTTMCKHDNCSNGGTCVAESQCVCPAGFFGLKCQFNIQALKQITFPVISSNVLDCSGNVERVASLPSTLWRRFFLTHQSTLPTSSISATSSTSGYLLFKGSDANCTSGGSRVSHDFANIFRGRLHEKGFTHTCTIYFGKGYHHNHVIYLYNTHHRFWDASTHGASLTYSNFTLKLTVDDGHRAFFLKLHWLPKLHNQPNVVTSSYSPLYGISLFANGVHLGSVATPRRLHDPAIQGQAHLCFGSLCKAGHAFHTHSHGYAARYAIADIKVFGASVDDLVLNGMAQLVGLPSFGHIVTSASHAATSVATRKSTTFPSSANAQTTIKPTSAATTLTTSAHQTTALVTATALVFHHSTTPGQCRDTSACAPLVAIGTAVCADSQLAHTDCRRSCNHCGDTNG